MCLFLIGIMKNIGSKLKEKRKRKTYNHYKRNNELEKDNQIWTFLAHNIRQLTEIKGFFGFPNLSRRKKHNSTSFSLFFLFCYFKIGKRFINLHKKPLFWTQHASVCHSIHIYESLFSSFLTQILLTNKCPCML